MIAVEKLYLTALLSAFIGLIALFVLSGLAIMQPVKFRGFLVSLGILATVVSLGSFFIYAMSPYGEARSVYSVAAISSLDLQ